MRLIDNVNLVPTLHRREEGFVTQVARVVDQTMSCGIQFNHI
jgi:hypothetical protein